MDKERQFIKHPELPDEKKHFREFFDLYYDETVEYVAKKIQERENVLDIVQNIFYHLWKYRKSLLEIEKRESILYKTAKQEIALYYRKNKMKVFSSEDTESFEDDSSKEIEWKEKNESRLKEVADLLEKIPERNRRIFIMNKLENISHKQIAKEMNVSESVVANQVSKILHYLKSNIHFFFFVC